MNSPITGSLPFDGDRGDLESWTRTTGADILRRLGIRPETNVLDIGSGFGAWTRCLLRLRARVTAVDTSLDALHTLREWNADIPDSVPVVVCADARRFLAICPAAAYDAVLLFDVLQFLDPWEPLMTNVRRVLKSGGVLAVNPGLSHHLDGDRALELVALILHTGFRPRVRFGARVVHYRNFTKEELWAFEKMDPEAGVSAFQSRVLAATWFIPKGRVTTYGALAARIGCGSPRAVGQALRRNPFAPDVPCHRVIASDLSPGGFQGARNEESVRAKVARLAAEGVRFRNGRLSDPACLWRF